jgi:hypothetical protein
MARNGSGEYSLPANTAAVSGATISSTKFNSIMSDLESTLNTARPVVKGGTGATTASAARTNLGLAIGTDVQAYDAGLASIAGLTTAANKMVYTTALDTYAVADLSAFARTILDDADASAVRTTIGAGTGSGDLLAANNLSDLASASTARSNLGVAIGSDVQAYDAGLAFLAGLSITDEATFKSSLNLEIGTDVQAYDADTTKNDVANTFTQTQTISGGAPRLVLNESDAGTDEKNWTLDASGDALRIRALTDALGGTSFPLVILRTGTTIDEIEFNATAFDFNGAMDVSGALEAASVRSKVPVDGASTGTLTSANINAGINLSGNITIPSTIGSAQDTIGPLNSGGASRTITRGSGLSMYVNGTNVASCTLAARGLAVIWFQSATVCYVTGDVS